MRKKTSNCGQWINDTKKACCVLYTVPNKLFLLGERMYKMIFRDSYSDVFKNNVQFYLENYDYHSDEFRQHIIKENERSEQIHEEFLRENKPEWMKRTDYFEKGVDAMICEVHFADILSNNGFSKLIDAIYRLPSRKYKVRCNYNRPSIFKKYDYVHYEYNGYSLSSVADIDFIDDKYIKSIHISKTQLNSFFEMVEYKISFKRCLVTELYDEFIYDMIKSVDEKKDFIIAFNTDLDDDKYKYSLLEDMHESYFLLICQHYITSLLYSEQGFDYPLISLTVWSRKEAIDINRLYLGDTDISYYSKENNYVISTDYPDDNYRLYAGNNRIPNFNFISMIGKYGNELYTSMFGRREANMFSNSFSKYASGRKRMRYNKDFHSLLKKMQSFSSLEDKSYTDFYKEFDKKWVFYIGNDKSKIKDFHKKTKKNLKQIYKENYEYFRINADINQARSNTMISVTALIIALLSMIFTVA